MLFRASFLSAIALLCANQALGATIEVERSVGAAEIATSPCLRSLDLLKGRRSTDSFLIDYACNCPNNCRHVSGSSCKYYSGPSDTSTVISGSKYR